jgi:hypothetical protein
MNIDHEVFDTRPNKQHLIELAMLVRKIFDTPKYKHVAHYSALIGELADAHDEVLKHARGTPGNYRAYALATRVFKAATTYANNHGFDAPNDVLRSMGYLV